MAFIGETQHDVMEGIIKKRGKRGKKCDACGEKDAIIFYEGKHAIFLCDECGESVIKILLQDFIGLKGASHDRNEGIRRMISTGEADKYLEDFIKDVKKRLRHLANSK